MMTHFEQLWNIDSTIFGINFERKSGHILVFKTLFKFNNRLEFQSKIIRGIINSFKEDCDLVYKKFEVNHLIN